MAEPRLRVDIDDRGVATVWLDDPPLNILDDDFLDDIRDTFARLGDDPAVSLIILRSTGPNLTAGFKVHDLTRLADGQRMSKHMGHVAGALHGVYVCPKPTIAVVRGYAVGAGCAMAGACDIVVAEENAEFWIPEIKIGFIGAASFLRLLVPSRLYRYYAMTGARFTGRQLMSWGSILDAVPDAELEDRVRVLIDEVLENSPEALIRLKHAMNQNDNDRMDEKFAVECRQTEQFSSSPDFLEAVMAFVEKRRPVYGGSE